MGKEIKKILTLKDIEYIEDKLNYTFKKKNLLTQAFTRKSFGIENKVPYNDVLKIVGDTVSKTLVTQLVTNSLNYNLEKFPNAEKYIKELEAPYNEYMKKLEEPFEDYIKELFGPIEDCIKKHEYIKLQKEIYEKYLKENSYQFEEYIKEQEKIYEIYLKEQTGTYEEYLKAQDEIYKNCLKEQFSQYEDYLKKHTEIYNVILKEQAGPYEKYLEKQKEIYKDCFKDQFIRYEDYLKSQEKIYKYCIIAKCDLKVDGLDKNIKENNKSIESNEKTNVETNHKESEYNDIYEYEERLMKVSPIATNIFDDYYDSSILIEDFFGVTIEQFLDNQITKYSDEELIDYSIRKLLFDKLILMNKSDINNKLIEKSETMVELYKSIMGAVAIDSGWDYNQLEEVFYKLIDFSGYDSIETKVDFVVMLEQWYYKNFNEIINYNYTHDVINKIHICEIDFSYDGNNYRFIGEAENKKKARQKCCEKAITELKTNGVLSKTKILALELNKLDGNNAINVLQELYQKKLCPEPHYEFEVEYDKDGNPIWKCTLDLARKVIGETFEDIYPFTSVSFSSKKEAKKMVAFTNLTSVSNQILKAQGLDVEIIRYNKNDNS